MFAQQFEARILWRSPRWLSFLKWPSAHEVAFGDFIAEFDFKMNVVNLRHDDGSQLEIASFSTQEGRAAVSTIKGRIKCGQHTIELVPPDGSAGPKLLIGEKGAKATEVSLSCDSGEYSCADSFRISPKVDGRDAYLEVEYSEGSFELAVISASLLVFNRFSAN